ncbi:hypothetical protein [Enterovibrio calviensis]|uniref:hypothetical protein n=1 Tax=Enterovibrio calviensis TaxID=91359 RepID=UPI0012DCB7D5|nr:hypothetical protein [Enterovibrio calviensis]
MTVNASLKGSTNKTFSWHRNEAKRFELVSEQVAKRLGLTKEDLRCLYKNKAH